MRTTTGTPLDRVAERQRAVALARHFREAEGLSIAQIAQRLGRTPATVKGYFYDPSGEKARAVKARYQGVCRGCGAPTQPRNGKGDAYEYCKGCHPGAAARALTSEAVREAMRRWRSLYGAAPSSYDWSRTHARERGRRGSRAPERGGVAGSGDRDRPVRVVGRGALRRVCGRLTRVGVEASAAASGTCLAGCQRSSLNWPALRRARWPPWTGGTSSRSRTRRSCSSGWAASARTFRVCVS